MVLRTLSELWDAKALRDIRVEMVMVAAEVRHGVQGTGAHKVGRIKFTGPSEVTKETRMG